MTNLIDLKRSDTAATPISIEYIAIIRQDDAIAVMNLLGSGASDVEIEGEIARTVAAWSDYPEWLPIRGWSRMSEAEVTAYRERKRGLADAARAAGEDPRRH